MNPSKKNKARQANVLTLTSHNNTITVLKNTIRSTVAEMV